MDKSCANHPESMALATCKACEKSICLMCVVDEKEGTFCSSDCHTAFANGQEVPKFVGAVAETAAPAAAASGAQKIESIFDDGPSAPPAPSEQLATPAGDDPMPIVAEGTKWRPIGAQCQNHSDTPAVANCDRCSKPVCALCLLEASQGTFCSADCMGAVAKQPAAQPAPAERAALQGRPQPVYRISKNSPSRRGANRAVIAASVLLLLALAAGGYYAWNSFSALPEPGPVVIPPAPPDPTPPVAVNPKPPDVVKPPVVVNPPVKPPDTAVTVTNPPPVTYTPRTRPKVVKPVLVQSRALNPWAELEPGAWFRIRSVRGNQVTYTDTGLKEKGKDFYVLTVQTSTNGQAAPAADTRTTVQTVYLRGEESFTYDGQTYLCEIRTASLDEKAPRYWSLLAGRNQGAVIKAEAPEGSYTATTVWEHTLKVAGQSLECLVVEGKVQNRPFKKWFCGTVPLGVVRMESEGESFAIVDLGSDWSKRPAFPK
jgi:hypothetical protein